MKPFLFTFLLLFAFPFLAFSQNDSIFYDADWDISSRERAEYYCIYHKEPIELPTGEIVYPLEYYKKNRLYAKAFSSKSDTIDLTYLNKFFFKNGKIKTIKLFNYQRYVNDMDEVNAYFSVIEPFLQDSFILYSEDFTLQIEFKRNEEVDVIAVVGTKPCCKMTRISSLPFNEYLLEDLVDNKPEGREFWFFKSGKIKSKKYFKKGRKHGRWEEYHQNGNLISVDTYDNGVRSGPEEFYRKNGTPVFKRTYLNGKLHGTIIQYHKNGQVQTKGHYKNGQQDGRWEYFTEDGHLRDYKVFEADRVD